MEDQFIRDVVLDVKLNATQSYEDMTWLDWTVIIFIMDCLGHRFFGYQGSDVDWRVGQDPYDGFRVPAPESHYQSGKSECPDLLTPSEPEDSNDVIDERVKSFCSYYIGWSNDFSEQKWDMRMGYDSSLNEPWNLLIKLPGLDKGDLIDMIYRPGLIWSLLGFKSAEIGENIDFEEDLKDHDYKVRFRTLMDHLESEEIKKDMLIKWES
jgi:hypothetical protein